MNSLLLIWGAGGHGRVVLDVALSTGAFKRIAFIDDDGAKTSRTFCGHELLGRADQLHRFTGSAFIVAIGDNRMRSQNFNRACTGGLLPATLIHPTAVISPSVSIGPGTVIMPGAIVNAGASIGENCIINSAAVIEHDCRLGPHVHVSPRAVLGGNVIVNSLAHIGIGAIVLPTATIGQAAVVGAGAVVLREAPPGCTVVGIPAKLLAQAFETT